MDCHAFPGYLQYAKSAMHLLARDRGRIKIATESSGPTRSAPGAQLPNPTTTKLSSGQILNKRRFIMRKYYILALLIICSASCAPATRTVDKKKDVAAGYEHLEAREKSKNAVDQIYIGNSGASFYYESKLWSVNNKSASTIDFSARRFTNAHIFLYDEKIPMTEIHKKLVEHYQMKNAQLVESEFINVNNSVLIYNKIEGMINKRKVSILSYGFSEGMHTIITHCFIYKSMLRNETEQEIIEFLNGFAAAG